MLTPPLFLNHELSVRVIDTDDEWLAVLELQCRLRPEGHTSESYRIFKTAQMQNYRRMAERGMGHWFGGFYQGKLVCDLGLYCDQGIGRYQSVETDTTYRREGFCGTLVYTVGKLIMEQRQLHTLVMEADEHYHAARIYELVGFKPHSHTKQLTWWQRTNG